MEGQRTCSVCGTTFTPDVRSRHHQRYCRRRCYLVAKRARDRHHKQRYRETGLGKEQRRRENEASRTRIGWNAYMRFWRKAKPKERARRERERARRYYLQHRAEILRKRRLKRAAPQSARTGVEQACSH